MPPSQLPVSPKLGLLYAAIESSERLRNDLVEAAANALLAEGLDEVRDRAAFEARLARVSRDLFPRAMQGLQLAEAILAAYATVKPKIEGSLMGWARANLDDVSAHLRQLVHAGFLRQTPAALLAEFPRYLKALELRADRAVADPAKDQGRLLELQPFAEALAAYKQLVEKVSFAQCWDTKGWFWKPAEGAKARIKALEFDTLK